MEKKNRFLAIFLAVAVIFVMSCSAFFIAAEADHDCNGEDCSVCCQINTCENNLKNLSLAICFAALAVAVTYTLCRSLSVCTGSFCSDTPVSLKVKLSD